MPAGTAAGVATRSNVTALQLWNDFISQRQPCLLSDGIQEQPALQKLLTLEALERHAVRSSRRLAALGTHFWSRRRRDALCGSPCDKWSNIYSTHHVHKAQPATRMSLHALRPSAGGHRGSRAICARRPRSAHTIVLSCAV